MSSPGRFHWPRLRGLRPTDRKPLWERVNDYFRSPVSFFNDPEPQNETGQLIYATVKGVEMGSDLPRSSPRVYFGLSYSPPPPLHDSEPTRDLPEDPLERIEFLARGGNGPDSLTPLPLSFTFRGELSFDEEVEEFRRFVRRAGRELPKLNVPWPWLKDLMRPNDFEQDRLIGDIDLLENADGPLILPVRPTLTELVSMYLPESVGHKPAEPAPVEPETCDSRMLEVPSLSANFGRTAESARIAVDRLVSDRIVQRNRDLFKTARNEFSRLAKETLNLPGGRVNKELKELAGRAKKHLREIRQLDQSS
jgi:hypothetical protein